VPWWPVYATNLPSTLTAGVSSATIPAPCAPCIAAAGQKFAFDETVNVCPCGLVPPPPFAIGLFGSTAGGVNTVTIAQLSTASKPGVRVGLNGVEKTNVGARLFGLAQKSKTTTERLAPPLVAVFCRKHPPHGLVELGAGPLTVIERSPLPGAAIFGETSEI